MRSSARIPAGICTQSAGDSHQQNSPSFQARSLAGWALHDAGFAFVGAWWIGFLFGTGWAGHLAGAAADHIGKHEQFSSVHIPSVFGWD
jgi:hypothetical protein